ncbi:MAG: hypothetical protein ACLTTH_10415 [Holdemanella porci]
MGYSIIFQFISTQTISRFYHRYAQITVEITTENPRHYHKGLYRKLQTLV